MDSSGPDWVKKYPMDFVGDCPLIIVVVYDPVKGGLGSYFGQHHGALQSASACIQNMMLKAADMDLESLWFTFFDPAALKPVLDIPRELDIAGAVLFGTPAMETRAPRRKTPKVHQNHFSTEA